MYRVVDKDHSTRCLTDSWIIANAFAKAIDGRIIKP